MFADRKEVKARKRFIRGQELRPRDDLGPKSTKYGAEKHRIWGRNTRNLGPKHARIWGQKIWGLNSRCRYRLRLVSPGDFHRLSDGIQRVQ
jgi:hypothetical protein